MTELQQRTFEAIRAALTGDGYLPTIKEIAAETGHASHGHLLRTVDQLEERGFLVRDKHRRWRSLRLVAALPA